jgi:hypothetical protein
MVKNNKVSEQDVNDAVVASTAQKIGEKTAVVVLTLKNGFEVVGVSSCVDAANYDHKIGVELATKKAIDKVWELLGYRLQDRLHEWGLTGTEEQVKADGRLYAGEQYQTHPELLTGFKEVPQFEASQLVASQTDFVETEKSESGDKLEDPSAA